LLRGIVIILVLAGLGAAVFFLARPQDDTEKELSPEERLERAREYFPRFQAWATMTDPGWILFDLLIMERDLNRVADHHPEEFLLRYRTEPEFAHLVDNLIFVYESNCVITGHLIDAVTGNELSTVILSFEIDGNTVRASSSGFGDFRAVVRGEPGREARVTAQHRWYYPAHGTQSISARVVTGCDFSLHRRLLPVVLEGTVKTTDPSPLVFLRGDWGLRWQTRARPDGTFQIPIEAPPQKGTVEVFVKDAKPSPIRLAVEGDTVHVPLLEVDPQTRGSSEPALAYLRDGEAQTTHRKSDVCGDRSFELKLGSLELPPRIGADETIVLNASVDWKSGGGEVDSANIVVQALFFDAPPQVVLVPRGSEGERTVSFTFSSADMTFRANMGKIQLSARSAVSCPGGKEGDFEARLFQAYSLTPLE